jgi:putative IMPACT (imprinted ancient) family translation regulator
MKELGAGKLEIRRSRFYAHLYAVESGEDLEAILELHRRRYRKAAHHCAALFLPGKDGAPPNLVFKNDGEVGQPGKLLLELLKNHELAGHALVVSRFFGGIKLGPGGVARAFRAAGDGVVKDSAGEGWYS